MKKLEKINKKETFKQTAFLCLGISGFSATLAFTSIVFNAPHTATMAVLIFATTWPITLVMAAGLLILKYLEDMNPLNSIMSGMSKATGLDEQKEEE